MFFAKPLQRSNLCASHRQRRWLTHGELGKEILVRFRVGDSAYPRIVGWGGEIKPTPRHG